MMIMKRRTFLGGTAALGAGLAAGFMPRLAAGKADEITVTAFGGVWEQAVRKCFVEPFEAKTKAKANVALGGPPQWLAQVQASPNDPPIDVLVMTQDLALSAAKANLVDEFTVDKIPNLAKIPQQLTDTVNGKGTLLNYGIAGITYNKNRIKNPPKSFVEFVDRVSKGEFVASVPSISWPVTPIMAIWAMANALGGGADNVDPFFQAMAKMKKNLVFWSGPNDFFNHLSSGEADVGIYLDGRTWNYYDNGATWIDFINPSEGGALIGIAVQKPKNASPLAWAYLNEALDAKNQTVFADILSYGVTNVDVVYNDKLKPRISPWQKTAFPPYEKIADVRNEWVDRWNREIGR